MFEIQNIYNTPEVQRKRLTQDAVVSPLCRHHMTLIHLRMFEIQNIYGTPQVHRKRRAVVISPPRRRHVTLIQLRSTRAESEDDIRRTKMVSGSVPSQLGRLPYHHHGILPIYDSNDSLESRQSLRLVHRSSFIDGSTRFPKLEECAHFHYDLVELQDLQVTVVHGDDDDADSVFRHDTSHHSHDTSTGAGASNFSLRVAAGGMSWTIQRSFANIRHFDRLLHKCIFDRRFSHLPEIQKEWGQRENHEEFLYGFLGQYTKRFSDIAGSMLNCGPILNWLELDNRGNRLLVVKDSGINTPAIAAAHAIRRYTAQAPDEISLEVGDIVSVIDMPPVEDSCWWRGKRGFEVGFFPLECVEIIGEKVPQAVSTKTSPKSRKPLLRKNGKLATLFRGFFSTRPSRNELKQSGIVKERVFGCDLGEHLLNASQDVPLVLRVCCAMIEEHGIVDGIYRLSGISSNIQKLRVAFDEDKVPDLQEECYRLDIHSISSLVKMYLRDLPNPLLTYQLYDQFADAVQDEENKLMKIHDVIQQLPPPHYRTTEFLIRHLARVASFSSQTGMHSKNLAIVWAPNLLRSKELEMGGGAAALQGVGIQAVVTEFMICYCDLIFNDKMPAQITGNSTRNQKKPRPKSLAISTPTRLLSLEEARERALSTKYIPDQKYIEVGGGPDTLPTRYHTVLDLPGYRKKTGLKENIPKDVPIPKPKKSPSESRTSKDGWRGFFSKTRNPSVKDKPRKASISDSLSSQQKALTEDDVHNWKRRRLRSSKSVESLVSTPSSQGSHYSNLPTTFETSPIAQRKRRSSSNSRTRSQSMDQDILTPHDSSPQHRHMDLGLGGDLSPCSDHSDVIDELQSLHRIDSARQQINHRKTASAPVPIKTPSVPIKPPSQIMTTPIDERRRVSNPTTENLPSSRKKPSTSDVSEPVTEVSIPKHLQEKFVLHVNSPDILNMNFHEDDKSSRKNQRFFDGKSPKSSERKVPRNETKSPRLEKEKTPPKSGAKSRKKQQKGETMIIDTPVLRRSPNSSRKFSAPEVRDIPCNVEDELVHSAPIETEPKPDYFAHFVAPFSTQNEYPEISEKSQHSDDGISENTKSPDDISADISADIVPISNFVIPKSSSISSNIEASVDSFQKPGLKSCELSRSIDSFSAGLSEDNILCRGTSLDGGTDITSLSHTLREINAQIDKAFCASNESTNEITDDEPPIMTNEITYNQTTMADNLSPTNEIGDYFTSANQIAQHNQPGGDSYYFEAPKYFSQNDFAQKNEQFNAYTQNVGSFKNVNIDYNNVNINYNDVNDVNINTKHDRTDNTNINSADPEYVNIDADNRITDPDYQNIQNINDTYDSRYDTFTDESLLDNTNKFSIDSINLSQYDFNQTSQFTDTSQLSQETQENDANSTPVILQSSSIFYDFESSANFESSTKNFESSSNNFESSTNNAESKQSQNFIPSHSSGKIPQPSSQYDDVTVRHINYVENLIRTNSKPQHHENQPSLPPLSNVIDAYHESFKHIETPTDEQMESFLLGDTETLTQVQKSTQETEISSPQNDDNLHTRSFPSKLQTVSESSETSFSEEIETDEIDNKISMIQNQNIDQEQELNRMNSTEPEISTDLSFNVDSLNSSRISDYVMNLTDFESQISRLKENMDLVLKGMSKPVEKETRVDVYSRKNYVDDAYKYDVNSDLSRYSTKSDVDNTYDVETDALRYSDKYSADVKPSAVEKNSADVSYKYGGNNKSAILSGNFANSVNDNVDAEYTVVLDNSELLNTAYSEPDYDLDSHVVKKYSDTDRLAENRHYEADSCRNTAFSDSGSYKNIMLDSQTDIVWNSVIDGDHSKERSCDFTDDLRNLEDSQTVDEQSTFYSFQHSDSIINESISESKILPRLNVEIEHHHAEETQINGTKRPYDLLVQHSPSENLQPTEVGLDLESPTKKLKEATASLESLLDCDNKSDDLDVYDVGLYSANVYSVDSDSDAAKSCENLIDLGTADNSVKNDEFPIEKIPSAVYLFPETETDYLLNETAKLQNIDVNKPFKVLHETVSPNAILNQTPSYFDLLNQTTPTPSVGSLNEIPPPHNDIITTERSTIVKQKPVQINSNNTKMTNKRYSSVSPYETFMQPDVISVVNIPSGYDSNAIVVTERRIRSDQFQTCYAKKVDRPQKHLPPTSPVDVDSYSRHVRVTVKEDDDVDARIAKIPPKVSPRTSTRLSSNLPKSQLPHSANKTNDSDLLETILLSSDSGTKPRSTREYSDYKSRSSVEISSSKSRSSAAEFSALKSRSAVENYGSKYRSSPSESLINSRSSLIESSAIKYRSSLESSISKSRSSPTDVITSRSSPTAVETSVSKSRSSPPDAMKSRSSPTEFSISKSRSTAEETSVIKSRSGSMETADKSRPTSAEISTKSRPWSKEDSITNESTRSSYSHDAVVRKEGESSVSNSRLRMTASAYGVLEGFEEGDGYIADPHKRRSYRSSRGSISSEASDISEKTELSVKTDPCVDTQSLPSPEPNVQKSSSFPSVKNVMTTSMTDTSSIRRSSGKLQSLRELFEPADQNQSPVVSKSPPKPKARPVSACLNNDRNVIIIDAADTREPHEKPDRIIVTEKFPTTDVNFTTDQHLTNFPPLRDITQRSSIIKQKPDIDSKYSTDKNPQTYDAPRVAPAPPVPRERTSISGPSKSPMKPPVIRSVISPRGRIHSDSSAVDIPQKPDRYNPDSYGSLDRSSLDQTSSYLGHKNSDLNQTTAHSDRSNRSEDRTNTAVDRTSNNQDGSNASINQSNTSVNRSNTSLDNQNTTDTKYTFGSLDFASTTNTRNQDDADSITYGSLDRDRTKRNDNEQKGSIKSLMAVFETQNSDLPNSESPAIARQSRIGSVSPTNTTLSSGTSHQSVPYNSEIERHDGIDSSLRQPSIRLGPKPFYSST